MLEEETTVNITFQKFLEEAPPNQSKLGVIGVAEEISKNSVWYLLQPNLTLYCASEACSGNRTFAPSKPKNEMVTERISYHILEYVCRNCHQSTKHFAIWAMLVLDTKPSRVIVSKLGEEPPFGPHTPARVISLIGPDRDLFLKGRRAESQGLGVGAFAYYRRVVENQKGRLIGEIKRVASRVNASPEDLARFDAAISETQFSKAIDDIKEAIPQSLLVNGQNPLMLLHKALSQGIHAGSDAECLELATTVRLVLTALAERTTQALKDEAELNEAIKRLTALRMETPTSE